MSTCIMQCNMFIALDKDAESGGTGRVVCVCVCVWGGGGGGGVVVYEGRELL